MSNTPLKHTYAQALSRTNSMSTSAQTRSPNPTTTPANQSYNNISTSIDNNTHPLFLHNNDQPGMVLISKKLTGSENYAS